MLQIALREAIDHIPRLLVFVEVARARSFRSAAKVLGMSPSTVSLHVKALEEAVGVRLIERTSRAVALTSAGKTLLSEAGELLSAWERGMTAARAQAEEPTGTMIVTMPPVVADHFVLPAIAAMLAAHPKVTVQLRVASATLDIVAEGIDLAVRTGPLPDSEYGARLLAKDQHVVVATRELAESFRSEHPKELEDAPWVDFAGRKREHVLTNDEGEQVRLTRRTVAAASEPGTCIGLVREGVGFGFLPQAATAQDIREGRLVAVLPRWHGSKFEVFAVTPSPKPKDAKVAAFIELLTDHAHVG